VAPRNVFISVGDVLVSLARRYGFQSKLFEARLQERWPSIAGETIAGHTRPEMIRFKRLYLLVENSVWLQQLTFLKPGLIDKINTAAGKPIVADIILRVGEIADRR
jgi:predicted nucleic acid-binding Zn ribbon protein